MKSVEATDTDADDALTKVIIIEKPGPIGCEEGTLVHVIAPTEKMDRKQII